MQLFYSPNINGNQYFLSKEESKHCVKVLRLVRGDELLLTNGLGTLYHAVLVDENLKGCEVKVVESEIIKEDRDFKVHVAIAPTKNIARFEWFVEKATEIGIDQISPILCAHSERDRIKQERIERIIQVAAKQSVKYNFPVLNELMSFEDFLKNHQIEQKFIAYCGDADKQELKLACKKESDAIVMIGPEGDFSPAEIESAIKNNSLPVSMGASRLRTETAGIVACHTIHLLNGH